jgi:glycine hydroxymethyltransferase
LVKADITLNKNMVPFDDKSPFITSGIRVGVAAMTTRGLKGKDMPHIVEWLDKVLMNPDDENQLITIKGEVNEFMSSFSLYPEWSLKG